MARTLALWLARKGRAGALRTTKHAARALGLAGFCLGALWLPAAAQSDPAILQIRVIEGEGAVYATGSRATRGVTVRVTDETGKPVEGVAVTFRLPDDGPTGRFQSGERVEAEVTAADGTALVWGMEWNRTPGPFEVRITAAKGQASAGTVCPLYLSDALAAINAQPGGPSTGGGGGGSGHKKLWIALAIAGAAVVGIAAASGGSASSGAVSAPSTAGTPRIGTPTITIGKP